MKDRSRTVYLLLFLSMLLCTMCTDEKDNIVPITDPQLIDNASEYFYSEVFSTANFSKKSTNEKNTLPYHGKRNLNWGKAKINTFGETKVIIIPVNYEDNIYIGNDLYKRSLDLMTFVKMVKIKGSNNYEVEMLTFLPDEDYLKGQTTKFSGLLLVETWAGDLLKSYRTTSDGFEEILITDSGSEESSKLMCAYGGYEIIYSECQFVTVDGEVIGEPICTEVLIVRVCYEPPMIAPPDGDTGGGGGPSGGAEPTEPNCDELEGYLVDENGNCIKVTCGEGLVKDEYGICVPINNCFGSPCCDENGNLIMECLEDLPCEGLPLKNMNITSPGASGINGGRFGCTRIGSHPQCPPGKKKHDGLDITASIGSYVFSPFNGEVVNIRDTFEWGEYLGGSYGNYVTVKYQYQNGTIFYIKFNHLDYVNVQVGDNLLAGTVLGRSGRTGNAAVKDVTPHVHLQVYNSSWQSIDPEDYLNVEYDENGIKIEDPC